jgi:hypothetical protein
MLALLVDPKKHVEIFKPLQQKNLKDDLVLKPSTTPIHDCQEANPL